MMSSAHICVSSKICIYRQKTSLYAETVLEVVYPLPCLCTFVITTTHCHRAPSFCHPGSVSVVIFSSSIVITHLVFVDLTMSCESWDSNAPYDVVPFPTADNHMNPIALYLGENIEMYLTHPYASPLFGDFKGLPPLLIQAGDAEVLRDEIMLVAHKATLAGVQVRHELYEDAVSCFYLFSLPVSYLAIRSTYFKHIHFLTLHAVRSSQCAISCARCCLNIKVDHHNCLV
jgi:alpha/beta hydrolase fold